MSWKVTWFVPKGSAKKATLFGNQREAAIRIGTRLGAKRLATKHLGARAYGSLRPNLEDIETKALSLQRH